MDPTSSDIETSASECDSSIGEESLTNHTALTPQPPRKQSWCESSVNIKCRYIAAAFVGVVLSGFYIGSLLFGNASLEVLLQLRTYEDNLEHNIQYLKLENARLQKSYFELKELEPLQVKQSNIGGTNRNEGEMK